jgi:hypothetical protein
MNPTNGISVATASTSGDVKRLRDNPGGVDWSFNDHRGNGEYFLVENRQKVGLDAALPGCGLLIWHVDEVASSGNDANQSNQHPLLRVEQADGLNDLGAGNDRGDTGDPWPGASNRHAFGPASNPNSNLNTGQASGVTLNIVSTTCAPTMTFDLTSTIPPTPVPPNDAFANAATISGRSGTVTGTTVNASVEAGEPAVLDVPSVWWKYTPTASGQLTLSTEGSDFDTVLRTYTGSAVGALTPVPGGFNDDSDEGLWSTVSIPVTAGQTYRIRIAGYDGATGAITLGWNGPGGASTVGDFNGDQRSDVGVFRPSTGQWFVNGQFVLTFGASGDVPVPGDYDGDGRADVAIYRPGTGQWYVNGQYVLQFGSATDIPLERRPALS